LRREETLALLVIGGAVLLLIEPTVENEVKKVIGASREQRYDDLLWSVAVNYNLDPDVLRACARTESNWDPSAVSLDGKDIGLFQIQIGTARLFRPEWKSLGDDAIKALLLNPENNADMAGRVLAELTAHGLGDSPAVFDAWNVGETKYRTGTRSPFVARYVVAYNDYTEGVA
jgi:soluble lytic murein transglycosylase-like protein